MTGVVEPVLERIDQCFFAIDGAFYNASKRPLKSLCALHQLFSALASHLPQDFSAIAQLTQAQEMLQQRIHQADFLNSAAQAALFAWITEVRSQYVAQYVLCIDPDWQTCERLWQHFCQAHDQSPIDQVFDYQGRYDLDIWSGLAELQTLSEVGFWRIQTGCHPLYDHNGSASTRLMVWLSSSLTKDELSQRFANWHWCAAPRSDQVLELALTERCSESSDWLHLLASERYEWRNNISIRQLYQSLQQHVSSLYGQRVDTLLKDVGRGLEVRHDAITQASNAQYCALYGGRLALVDERFSTLETVPLTNTSLPVYRLTFAEQDIIIPAYRVEPGSQVHRACANLTFEGGQWVTAPDDCEAEQLLVQGVGEWYLLRPERIERDYAVVQKAPLLPPRYNNYWRLRDTFLFEPTLPSDVRGTVPPAPLTLQGGRSSSDWLTLQWEQGQELVLSGASVVTVMPAAQIELVDNALMYCAGSVVPLIRSAEVLRDSDIIVLLGSSSEAMFALHVARVKVSTTQPEGVLDSEGIVLNWRDNCLKMTLCESGYVLFDLQAMRVCHQQLVEIFFKDGC